MFEMWNNDNPSSNYSYTLGGPGSAKYEDYETRRRRNETITRDYFRNLYGADPWDVGLEVPDWKWDW